MNFKNKTKKLNKKVRERLKVSPRCHDWEHTLRVIHNTEVIMVGEKDVDRQVVFLGALLHDIARADEIAIQGKQCHATRGAELAKKILKKEEFNKKFRKKVVMCVKRHRYRSSDEPITVEEKIVYDADKLDSVGAVGVGRAFLFAGNVGAKVHNTAEDALNSQAYSENDTAYREFLVKQQHIPGKMLTVTGRKIALERVKFMETFFDKLNGEIYS